MVGKSTPQTASDTQPARFPGMPGNTEVRFAGIPENTGKIPKLSICWNNTGKFGYKYRKKYVRVSAF